MLTAQRSPSRVLRPHCCPSFRNAQKLQSKQTNTSPGPASASTATPRCRTGEHRNLCWFAHVYVQLAAPVGTVGVGGRGQRRGLVACFAVCFWQAKHKAQGKQKKEGKKKSILYEICMATLPGKQLRKVVFQVLLRHVAGRMFTTGNSTNVRLTHTHTLTFDLLAH